jgi:hypothetical protein
MNIVLCGIVLFFFYPSNFSQAHFPTILIKIPTRSRPEKFFNILSLYYQNLSQKIPYHFIISCDTNDTTMNNPQVIEKLKEYPHLTYYFAENSSKVEAYNQGINRHDVWDILVVVSDDMVPIVKNFDQIIVTKMLESFPDFDGVLNFNDGHVGARLNTLPIIGKKYYDRFGYIYNPAYRSLYCDEELTLVSQKLHKEKSFSQVIIQHDHPIYGYTTDLLYQFNESLKKRDKKIFIERKKHNFYITPDFLDNSHSKKLSILICTLKERKKEFDFIYKKIKKQISSLGLEDRVEVLFFKDDRDFSVGLKRNSLLAQSSGEYVCFLDDDDDVHQDYIKMIYEKIYNKPDCISLKGILFEHKKTKKIFIHSIAYKDYIKKDSVFYRPPNHLNPIKRSIAIQFQFPDKNKSEDTEWAMKIARSGLLKKEEVIDSPYYFYKYVANKK